MTIIDSQVHAYQANTPKRPWHSVPNWPYHVTGHEMVAAMDKVGVDGAIFISAFSMYRYDASAPERELKRRGADHEQFLSAVEGFDVGRIQWRVPAAVAGVRADDGHQGDDRIGFVAGNRAANDRRAARPR
jgi:predicted TIM-barrel fold metal-dependent hydrolase